SVATPQGTTGYGYVTGQGIAKEHALALVNHVDGTHEFFSYDANGRLAGQHRDNNAGAVTLAYNGAAGVTFTDATHGATKVLYDDAGQATQVVDALGRTTQFAHDLNFNLVRLVTPVGSSYSYTYDRF